MPKLSLKNWPAYFLSLMPIAIISGPFFSDLITIIIVFWFIYKILNSKELFNKYIKNRIFLFFIVFNVCLVISSCLSSYTLFSLKSSLFYFRFYFLAFAICYIFDYYNNAKKYLLYSLSFSILLIFFSAIFDLIFIKNFFKSVNLIAGEQYRVSGLFGNELIMGSIFKKLVVALLVLIITLKKFKIIFLNQFLLITLVGLIFSIILISGERVAILMFGLFMLSSGYILRKKLNILKIFFFQLIFLIILLTTFSELQTRVIKDTYYQIQGKDLSDNSIAKEFKEKTREQKQYNENFIYLSIHHDAHARTALRMFSAKPIFGHGPNNFRNICKNYEYNQYSCTTHPHNNFLQLLSETGISGFIFLLIAIFFVLHNIKKKNHNNDLSLKIISAFILIYFIPFIPSGNFFNNYVNINFYMLVGIYIYLLNRKENKLI